MSSVDVLCTNVVVGGAAVALVVAASKAPRGSPFPERVTALPAGVCRVGLRALAPVVRAAVAAGVSANTITLCSLMAGAAAGLFLAEGHFGVAGALFVAASCGDALDGLVARATCTQSPGGAIFDASVDRYEEFFAFGGLALFFRSSGVVLALTLLALAGAFMVSYGSAQAEARHLSVPPGLMRRPERAVVLGLGIVLCPLAESMTMRDDAPAWSRDFPVILALLVIALASNVSAVRRVRRIAVAARAVSLREVDLRHPLILSGSSVADTILRGPSPAQRHARPHPDPRAGG